MLWFDHFQWVVYGWEAVRLEGGSDWFDYTPDVYIHDGEI